MRKSSRFVRRWIHLARQSFRATIDSPRLTEDSPRATRDRVIFRAGIDQLRRWTVIWIAAIVFVVAGVFTFVRRAEIARGQSMFWGGTTVPGCVTIQAILLVLLGIAFVAFRELGLLG